MIEEELRKREAINESDVELSDAMKEVTKLSAKFCPMPKGPLDLYYLFSSFERFASNLRWAWFHFRKNRDKVEDSDDDDDEEEFIMTPWYKRTERKAPKGNNQLEAALERLRESLFDTTNRRRVVDNMIRDQRQAMVDLRNLPNTSNSQVTFEDKGSRFVIRNLDYQENLIMEQLTDREHFDEIIGDPTEQVKNRIIDFCDQWSDELNDFHPNVINFLTNLSGTKPSTVKGLVKCHKPPQPDGKHDIRLLLASCGTPSNPASKLFQYSISHIFPHLKSKMKDTKAILAKILDINEQFPDGLPDSAIHVGCDVKKLYPSVDKEMGLAAVRKWLVFFPKQKDFVQN